MKRPLEEIALSACFVFAVVGWTAAQLAGAQRERDLAALEARVAKIERDAKPANAQADPAPIASAAWNAKLPERALSPIQDPEVAHERDRTEARWKHWREANAHFFAAPAEELDPAPMTSAELAAIQSEAWGALLEKIRREVAKAEGRESD